MGSDPARESASGKVQRPTRIPLNRSGRRLSFEKRIRIWLYLMGLPAFMLCWLLVRSESLDTSVQAMILVPLVLSWAFVISLFTEQIIRPLQTLANVVAALREDDYSFRARGARRNDAIGDLAIEVNALATMLQVQRISALEAMALVERVISSMPSPVLAFDPEGKLKLLNAAGEEAFDLRTQVALGQVASRLKLDHLLDRIDGDLIQLASTQPTARWMVRRATFRLRGVPHTLFVLAEVSAALREEERSAWERLIRVLGHEINNSLTPIKSIAGSLRARLTPLIKSLEDGDDFERGLEVIENRAESLNRFLQAYRQLMGLPSPKLEPVSLSDLIQRVAHLETRVSVTIASRADLRINLDADQIEQALINLVRNAADAALSADPPNGHDPSIDIDWIVANTEVIICIRDTGHGLTNQDNLFVPFYTTKPGGTGVGLVLAQQIAQGHGGTVTLSNRNDGQSGCKAELRLPV
jgi:two-component system, NtrC family, nitrogen regulation sensor histidine kinase NtrY